MIIGLLAAILGGDMLCRRPKLGWSSGRRYGSIGGGTRAAALLALFCCCLGGVAVAGLEMETLKGFGCVQVTLKVRETCATMGSPVDYLCAC